MAIYIMCSEVHIHSYSHLAMLAVSCCEMHNILLNMYNIMLTIALTTILFVHM